MNDLTPNAVNEKRVINQHQKSDKFGFILKRSTGNLFSIDCKQFIGPVVKIQYVGNEFPFSFDFEVRPEMEGDRVTFTQRSLNNIQNTSYRYNVVTKETSFNAILYRHEPSNAVALTKTVSHEVLDTFKNSYGTFLHVYHFSNPSIENLELPQVITDVWFDRVFGVVSFRTRDDSHWDIMF